MMLRNFMALGTTTLVRVLTGFVLFVLLAHHWGAEAFGRFMYLFSVASLLVIACEFGFSQQILREVGRAPERAPELMGSYLAAKIWLTAGAFVLALFYGLISGLSAADALILLCLLLAATLLSYGDFLLACLRALGRFRNETEVTLKGNVLYFAGALAALYGGGGLIGVALAMVLARALHLWLTQREYGRHVAGSSRLQLQPGAVFPVIGRSAPYGIDGAVATIFMNIDTILISHILGNTATGIYQAGARFYQGACLLAPIFGSLYLPRLAHASARDSHDKALFSRHFRQLSLGLLVTGLLLALGFAFSDLYIGLIFGRADFAHLQTLLPWFGVLVLARFGASIYGTVLTAMGGQGVRVLIYIAALASMIPAALLLMQPLGVVGMVLAVILAHIILTMGLAWRIARYGQGVHGIWLLTVLLMAVAAFVYWNTGF